MKTEEINYKRFKDVEASPRDRSWGTTVTAAGMEHIVNTEEQHEESHAGCKFNENGRSVLNEYRLIYITRGAGYFESASYSKVKLTAGMMAMLFPGEWHSFQPDKECGWDCYWVGFNGINIDNKIRNSFFAFRHCIYRLGVDDKVIATLQEILDVIEKEKKGYQQLAAGLIDSLIGRIYYMNENHSTGESYIVRVINQAKSIMREDITSEKSIEEIAASLGVTYSMFRREFKHICNISPGQYRLEQKLSKAMELLLTTNDSIAEIANKLHFENIGQFSAFFKKKKGISPLEYRKKGETNILEQ